MNASQNQIKSLYHSVRQSADSRKYWPNVTQVLCAHRQTGRLPVGLGVMRDKCVAAVVYARQPVEPMRPMVNRFSEALLEKYRRVIHIRGGETYIENTSIKTMEHHDGFTLLGCDGWRRYSRSFGDRPASLRYLCGNDDNGAWAVRIPGTVNTIADAIEFIEPAEVKKARLAGKQILRQGDVYFVEQSRDNMTALNGTKHLFDGNTRTVQHTDSNNPHSSLFIPFKAKAFVQSVLRMGRMTGRRQGD